MEIGTASLPPIVEKALEAMRAQARGAGHRPYPRTLPEALPPVLADANKILWVLTNLVANALRYTPRGGFVRISAEQDEASVRVEVRDNGQGIPYEDQARMFEKFFQARGGGQRAAWGSVWRSARKSSAPTGAPSGWTALPGRGALFSFTLPRADRG